MPLHYRSFLSCIKREFPFKHTENLMIVPAPVPLTLALADYGPGMSFYQTAIVMITFYLVSMGCKSDAGKARHTCLMRVSCASLNQVFNCEHTESY
jgi:hypothetical protein